MNRISNLDIMKDDLDSLFCNFKADCLYSDPPWGEATLKYWRTMNKEKVCNVNWYEFLNRIKYIYNKHVSGPLFLETGIRFEKDLINVFGKTDARYECVYGSKKLKNLLLCWGDIPEIDLTGKSSVDLVYSCLSSLSFIPKIVFDPCVGLGNTAKACKKIGCTLFANDINKYRLNKTENIMEFYKC